MVVVVVAIVVVFLLVFRVNVGHVTWNRYLSESSLVVSGLCIGVGGCQGVAGVP